MRLQLGRLLTHNAIEDTSRASEQAAEGGHQDPTVRGFGYMVEDRCPDQIVFNGFSPAG
jgi:hypothetical protein